MTLTRHQGIAIAGIVAAGLIAGSAVLFTGRHDTAKDDHESAERQEPAEDRVHLTRSRIDAADIRIQAIGATTLRLESPFQGEIRVNDDRTAHVVPRVAGIVDSVHATLGQQVRQGDVLAVLSSTAISEMRSELQSAQKRANLAKTTFERERTLWLEKISPEQDYLQAQAALQEGEIAVSNAAQKLRAIGAAASSVGLARYELRAPFSGTITEKHLTLGEAVKEDAAAFVLSDLSTVWADFVIAPRDLASVRVGQTVTVTSSAAPGSVEARVGYVGPLLGEQTRTARARATLVNPDPVWRPGLFVTVRVVEGEVPVAIGIPADAVQTVEDKPSVFVSVPDGFETRHIRTGRTDGRHVEVLDGLTAGESIAVSNTFVIKSELGKAGAEHGH